jgi:methylmalonyl-CoA mutase N-terminal domain/subunit
VQKALEALTKAAREEQSPDNNLLALAIEAARVRATVGEISDALEVVWGRHSATGSPVPPGPQTPWTIAPETQSAWRA